ncbi:nucleoside kinase [Niameybacter massiliensis]|uniref:Nucleoside kinase n=1 Tax=Holtiella tumoricola TaxID=3018743 RepID=A0AA42J1J0_9FIRM|nr:nucleoside kinase [Holtiella tumoricola]MDA3732440.1 nucleoside kinase [Holtiella tumoricola]
MVKIQFNDGRSIEVQKGTTFATLAKTYQLESSTPIVAARVGNVLRELYIKIEEDLQDVSFVNLSQKDGMRIYQRTATFLLIAATQKCFPHVTVLVNHHITGGYFCEFDQMADCTPTNLARIEACMREMVAKALPITKTTVPIDEALKLFNTLEMPDKEALFKYRRTSTINVYHLDGVDNYFYGYMMPSVEQVTCFKLQPYAHGFILLFPDEANPTELAKFVPQPKLSAVFRESEKWARILDVDIVASLNKVITQGRLPDLIRVSEALHEKKIAGIADQIAKQSNVRLVMIAGPSSSGKTTFAQRLCIQLRVNGLNLHVISIDDYFVNRDQTPLDEDGKYDFEALEAIDIQLFNEHMSKLIKGETVEIPTFNFKTGQREYKGHKLALGEEDVLVIEGIHGLNERLSYAIPRENKFKIYVSCLTQLNVDYHNRIPTTDTRLIRRMIRDNQYRGMSAEQTLAQWSSVRRGENRNIFPFQEEADVMFNTVLIYELAVLKQKAEPLLFGIDRKSPYYSEAKRLLKFLEYFLTADTEDIPRTSIIREFIGGSCFH